MFKKHSSHHLKYTRPLHLPSSSLTNKTSLTCLKRKLAFIIKNSECVLNVGQMPDGITAAI